MNVYDATRMQDVLAPLGYQSVDSAEGADMVILNPCHIREKAAEKVFSDLGRVRKHKEAKDKILAKKVKEGGLLIVHTGKGKGKEGQDMASQC